MKTNLYWETNKEDDKELKPDDFEGDLPDQDFPCFRLEPYDVITLCQVLENNDTQEYDVEVIRVQVDVHYNQADVKTPRLVQSVWLR